jgi:hypothetical protein
MRELFLEMDCTNPELQEAMELEKVKQWKPARLTHYETLRRAMQQYDAVQERRRVPA